MSLTEKLQALIAKILVKLSRKKIIIFESVPDISDNTLAVFEEMIKRGYYEKYKLVWQLENRDTDTSRYDEYCYDYIVADYKTFSERVKRFYYVSAASLFITSNRFIYKHTIDNTQRYLHLAHGCALKKATHYQINKFLDNADILTLSDFFIEYDSINLGCKEEQLKPLGYPRCDDLFKNNIDINNLFKNSDFTKAIYWMPTYRQHRGGKLNHSSVAFPIIYNEEIAKQINDCAKENGVMIIVKPHPVQDLSVIKALDLSNLKFIDNEFLSKNNIKNYELLGSCDAMLSDYSSVYYDYLLCDKPIGLCFDDYDEYNSKEGFTVDPDFILKGGEKLYNAEDLCNFISGVANGKDELKEERNEILNLVHKYKDSNTSKRVVDFIEKEYSL